MDHGVKILLIMGVIFNIPAIIALVWLWWCHRDDRKRRYRR